MELISVGEQRIIQLLEKILDALTGRSDNYEKMDRDQLIDLCSFRGIEVEKHTRNTTIIKMLRDHDEKEEMK